MAEFCMHEKHGGVCNLTGSYCNLGPCPNENIEEFAPIQHGRWIDAYPDIEPNPMFMYGICSKCGFEQAISKYLNYCPNCGAKMDESTD